jgi:hypothetical protein
MFLLLDFPKLCNITSLYDIHQYGTGICIEGRCHHLNTGEDYVITTVMILVLMSLLTNTIVVEIETLTSLMPNTPLITIL